MAHKNLSPLRYPGGKRRLAKYFKQVFEKNSLQGGVYVEPYAGGASVALSLLFSGYASKIIINDIDKSIYSFWYSVLNDTEKLCKYIYDTQVTLKIRLKQKEIQKQKDTTDSLSLGFSTFYLNRTNRSGIIKGGAIGGNHQTGKWKIDARFNKTDLIKRIEQIAVHKNNIELYNEDALNLITSLRTKTSKDTLYYFDPPYYYKGKDLYLNHYAHTDHSKIAKEIGKIKEGKWIVTYDSVEPICELYCNYRQSKFLLNYSAAEASNGNEVMIFSDNINMVESPIIQPARKSSKITNPLPLLPASCI